MTNARPTTARRAAVRRGVATALGATVALAACTTPDAEGRAEAAGPTGTTTAQDTSAVQLPGTPVGEQARWVHEVLAGDEPVSADVVAPHFSPELLEAVPADHLAQVLDGVRALGGWDVAAYDGDEAGAVLTISGDAPAYDVHLAVDGGGLLSMILFNESVVVREPAPSWDALAESVAALPADTSLLVSEVTDGDPQEVFATGSGESAPVGSMIKLYVLGALVHAVESGDLSWEDEVVVTDDLRSLPTGELQDAPTGSAVPVREAAELMISISDNTATDLLIDQVGADAVLAAIDAMGHSDPAVNDPLLTTRAFFQLGWGSGPDRRDVWRDGDTAARAALLDALPGGSLEISPEVVAFPVWADGVDWFATPEDLVAAHVALAELAGTPAGEPVREILAATPGLRAEAAERWDHVGYKGGSSVGTFGGSWYVERGGRAYVVVLQAAADDPHAFVVPETFVVRVEDALALVEE